MSSICVQINCRNGEQYLRSCLLSLVGQTFKDFYVLFVDNCSTDNSIKIVEQFSDDLNIEILRTPEPFQLGEARQFGLDHIDTDYVSFLDVDDEYYNDKLEKQLNLSEREENWNVMYSGYDTIDSKGNVISSFKMPSLSSEEHILYHLKQFRINMQTVMIRNGKVKFPTNLDLCTDLKAFLPSVLDNKAIYLPEQTVRYRMHDSNLSRSSYLQFEQELEVYKWLAEVYPQWSREIDRNSISLVQYKEVACLISQGKNIDAIMKAKKLKDSIGSRRFIKAIAGSMLPDIFKLLLMKLILKRHFDLNI